LAPDGCFDGEKAAFEKAVPVREMLLGLSQKGMRGLALEGAVFTVSDGSRVERVFEECNREAETCVLSVLRMCRLEFVLDRCAKGAGGEQGTARSVMR